MSKQIIIILVQNKPGVLTKVASLCRRRRFNIESLTVSTTIREDISQITLVFFEREDRITQITNQIRKIIEVISIEAAEPSGVIDKELVLLIAKNKAVADKLLKNDFHNAYVKLINTVDRKPVLEILAEGAEIDHILDSLDFKKDLVKIVRSGLVALKV